MQNIYCQSEDLSLAKQIMSEQIKNGWPGLCKQAPLISNELNIEGLFDHDVDKAQFKSLVQKACQNKNEENLKNQIATYKKMSALRDELIKGNGYFYTETLKNARVLFRFRVDLIEAKMNFKQKYQKEGLLCDSCETKIDENTHILHCPSYFLLRQNRNINDDTDLAEYLREVLEIRGKLRLNR